MPFILLAVKDAASCMLQSLIKHRSLFFFSILSEIPETSNFLEISSYNFAHPCFPF